MDPAAPVIELQIIGVTLALTLPPQRYLSAAWIENQITESSKETSASASGAGA
jgi:hypothetical protein